MAVKRRSSITKLVVLVASALILAININTFVTAGELIPGGFTGLTLFIQRIFAVFMKVSVPYTVINFILNAVPAVVCYQKIGKKFTLYSCLVVVLTSIFTDLLPKFNITSDLTLISIFGGLINGFGISLCLIVGATSGGSDFLSLLMMKKGITHAWYYIFIGNVILIAAAGVTFGWEKALYSIIFQFASTQIINMLHRRYKRNTLSIITDYPNEVYEIIKNVTHHGGTIFTGTGCYKKETKNMVYSIVASDEVKTVISRVKEIDEDAFINIIKTEQLVGKFYERPEE
ncbi:MAG: YitT family protein [Clostridiales bacterium]|nr:YitT family protein [Clostridiales bacterium]